MLNPELNHHESVTFALHSIDNMGSNAIQDIINDRDLFLHAFLLFEYHNYPSDVEHSQVRVCANLVQKLTKSRARDLVEVDGLQRCLKNFKLQTPAMKKVIVDLFFRTITLTL